jgi:transcriptional regulator with XRE-family HTH domain
MIYKNVKALADKEGLSIAELEKKAGLSNGTIGKWIESSPKVDSLVKVANVLGVGINKLVNGPVNEAKKR